MSDTRNDGFLSIIEDGATGTAEMTASAVCDNNCDCYDCNYNCEECDNT